MNVDVAALFLGTNSEDSPALSLDLSREAMEVAKSFDRIASALTRKAVRSLVNSVADVEGQERSEMSCY
jgi:HSP90 family molecular chaperone